MSDAPDDAARIIPNSFAAARVRTHDSSVELPRRAKIIAVIVNISFHRNFYWRKFDSISHAMPCVGTERYIIDEMY